MAGEPTLSNLDQAQHAEMEVSEGMRVQTVRW